MNTPSGELGSEALAYIPLTLISETLVSRDAWTETALEKRNPFVLLVVPLVLPKQVAGRKVEEQEAVAMAHLTSLTSN